MQVGEACSESKNLIQCHAEWFFRAIALWWCSGWTSTSWAKRKTCTPSVSVWVGCRWTSVILKNWPNSSLTPTNRSSARSVCIVCSVYSVVFFLTVSQKIESIDHKYDRLYSKNNYSLTKKWQGLFSFHTSYEEVHICKFMHPRGYGSLNHSVQWNQGLR